MFDENTRTIAVLTATVLLIGTAVVPAVGLGDTDTLRGPADEATNTTMTTESESPSPTPSAFDHRSPAHRPNNTTDDPEQLRTPLEWFLANLFSERGLDLELPGIVPPDPPARDDDRRPPSTTTAEPTTTEESETTPTETTPTERAEPDSFDVSGLNAPDSATVGDTIEVSATVSNPNDRQITQSVAFRFGGITVDRRSIALAAGEAATVTFEFDTGRISTDAYNYNAFIHGVYTQHHGELATIELNDHATTTEPTATPTPETSTPTETATSTTDTPTTTDATPEPTTPTETTEETTTETLTTTETTTDTTTTAPPTTTTTTEVPTPTATTVETTVETTTTPDGTTTTETTTTTPESSYAERVEQAIHEEVNRIRQERGLAPLAHSSALEAVADYHSTDMAERDYFDHAGPNGETVGDRYEQFGVSCQRWGENILYNYHSDRSPEQAAQKSVRQWMNSDGHRRNILSENWDNEAIGVYIDEGGRLYATQNFGTDCST